MQKINIAIVGLGRVGSVFLNALMEHPQQTINIAAVAELQPTPGYQSAIKAEIPVYSLVDLIEQCAEIDVLFDLTGSGDVRHFLREGLAIQKNHRTVIAPESVVRMLLAFIADPEALPDVHAESGYQ